MRGLPRTLGKKSVRGALSKKSLGGVLGKKSLRGVLGKKSLRAPLAAVAAFGGAVAGWGAAVSIQPRVRTLLPAGVSFTGVICADTACRMGPSLHTPDGRGPIHLASVTGTGALMSTCLASAALVADKRWRVRIPAAVYTGVGLTVYGIYLRFVRDVSEERVGPVPADIVIVCGAGLVDGQVSRVLANRVRTGVELWQWNLESGRPSALILCGGQGEDEPRSEAEAMAEYARRLGAAAGDAEVIRGGVGGAGEAGEAGAFGRAHVGGTGDPLIGIPSGCIILEDDSSTTQENLENAWALIQSWGIGAAGVGEVGSGGLGAGAGGLDEAGADAQKSATPRVAIVSTDFHCKRIRLLLEQLADKGAFASVPVQVVGADNPANVQVHSTLREFVALAFMRVKRLLGC